MDIRKQDSDLPSILNRTLASMGVPWNRDLNSGSMRGFSMHPYTVDERNVRSDAATAYYLPAAKRGNLEVMFNASVGRIVWGDRVGQEEGLVAKGVEVYGPDKDGRKQVVKARKEVILAAGAMKSSAILELSGVGNPRSVCILLLYKPDRRIHSHAGIYIESSKNTESPSRSTCPAWARTYKTNSTPPSFSPPKSP